MELVRNIKSKMNMKFKYHNTPTERMMADGTKYKFSSAKEAKRYDELILLQKAGKIKHLQLQVPYLLIPAQYDTDIGYTPKTHKEKKVKKLIERKLVYVADFVYQTEDGETVVEDVKGYRQSSAYNIYTIKRKLMLYFYGIKVREV